MRGKKLLFMFLLFTGVYLTIEGTSFLLFKSITGESYSLIGIAEEQKHLFLQKSSDSGSESVVNATPFEALHPYLGYVLDENENITVPRSDEGFVDTSLPVLHRREGEVIIGILGGSLASMFYLAQKEKLPELLQKSSSFAGRKVRFVNLALGGYKEPQQLFSFLWVLSRGGEFDYLINIDGLNDIALAPIENIPAGVSPYYPRSWHLRVEGMPDYAEKLLMGRVALLKEERKIWARRMFLPVSSVTLDLLWKWRDNLLLRQQRQFQYALLHYGDGRKLRYVQRGARYQKVNDGKLPSDLARLWKECSLLIAQICRTRGITYLHLLQPNQYVPAGKKMGREEKRIAYREDSPYKKVVEEGYPLLRHAGEELRHEGVNFSDETLLFKDVKEQVYMDSCCHLNALGNTLLGEEVAELLIKQKKGVKQGVRALHR